MTRDDIRKTYIHELINIAPDIEPDDLGYDDQLQDDLEFDSMDVLNLVSAIDKHLGVSVPEEDYPQIETVNKAVEYLAKRLGV